MLVCSPVWAGAGPVGRSPGTLPAGAPETWTAADVVASPNRRPGVPHRRRSIQALPLRSGRKRALGTRAPLTIPQGPNQRWSMDFVSDALADGGRFRVLAVVDDHTRECLALAADTSPSGARAVRELDATVAA